MRPGEARVYILERDPELLTELTDFVTTTGGEVVGVADPSKFHMDIAGHFPTNAGNPNVVLIDGVRNRDRGPDERESDNSDHYFSMGYRRGFMHRADTTDSLGAVAIGYDPVIVTFDNEPGGDPLTSLVEFATGANLSAIEDREAAAVRWADLLEPHPAEPVYLELPHDKVAFLGPHRIERTQWFDGYTFGQIINSLTNPDPDAKRFAEPVPMDVKVHTLSATESKGHDTWNTDPTVVHSEATEEPTTLSLQDFIRAAGDFQARDTEGEIAADSRTVQAILEANGYIFVINSTIDRGQHRESTTTKTDKIALDALSELPADYWKSVGMDRPVLT